LVRLAERREVTDGEAWHHSGSDIVVQLDAAALAAIVGTEGVSAYTAISLGVGDQTDITLTQAMGDLSRAEYSTADGDVLVNAEAFEDLAALNREAALAVLVQEIGHSLGLGELDSTSSDGRITASMEEWDALTRDEIAGLTVDAGVDSAQTTAFKTLYGVVPGIDAEGASVAWTAVVIDDPVGVSALLTALAFGSSPTDPAPSDMAIDAGTGTVGSPLDDVIVHWETHPIFDDMVMPLVPRTLDLSVDTAELIEIPVTEIVVPTGPAIDGILPMTVTASEGAPAEAAILPIDAPIDVVMIPPPPVDHHILL
jgi:hypothetical protein